MRTHPRAFTLIEVLVVIAIVALLASLLLPALGMARVHGRSIACLANLREMAGIANAYSLERKGAWPICFEDMVNFMESPDPPVAQGEGLQLMECPANRAMNGAGDAPEVGSYLHAAEFPWNRPATPSWWPRSAQEWRKVASAQSAPSVPLALDVQPWHGWLNAGYLDGRATKIR